MGNSLAHCHPHLLLSIHPTRRLFHTCLQTRSTTHRGVGHPLHPSGWFLLGQIPLKLGLPVLEEKQTDRQQQEQGLVHLGTDTGRKESCEHSHVDDSCLVTTITKALRTVLYSGLWVSSVSGAAGSEITAVSSSVAAQLPFSPCFTTSSQT